MSAGYKYEPFGNHTQHFGLGTVACGLFILCDLDVSMLGIETQVECTLTSYQVLVRVLRIVPLRILLSSILVIKTFVSRIRCIGYKK